MNWGMVVFGLLLVGLGIYRFRNLESTVETNLRWHDVRPRQFDATDYPRTYHRHKRLAVTILGLGLVMVGWGILDWNGDSLALVLLCGITVGVAWAEMTYGTIGRSS